MSSGKSVSYHQTNSKGCTGRCMSMSLGDRPSIYGNDTPAAASDNQKEIRGIWGRRRKSVMPQKEGETGHTPDGRGGDKVGILGGLWGGRRLKVDQNERRGKKKEGGSE